MTMTTMTTTNKGQFFNNKTVWSFLPWSLCGSQLFGCLLVVCGLFCVVVVVGCLLLVVGCCCCCWLFVVGGASFVVGHKNSRNNNGHNGCVCTSTNNHDQFLVNKPPTNQQTRTCHLHIVMAVKLTKISTTMTNDTETTAVTLTTPMTQQQ